MKMLQKSINIFLPIKVVPENDDITGIKREPVNP